MEAHYQFFLTVEVTKLVFFRYELVVLRRIYTIEKTLLKLFCIKNCFESLINCFG